MFVMFLFMCDFDVCSFFFFFKQKTAYELRISDWSSDVCSSDLVGQAALVSTLVGKWIPTWPWRLVIFGWALTLVHLTLFRAAATEDYVGRNLTTQQIGRASCRERVCQYV